MLTNPNLRMELFEALLDILLAAPRAVSGLTYRIFIITHNICTGHQMATGLQEPVVS